MEKRPIIAMAGALTAALATTAFVALFVGKASAVNDPRQEPPLVKLVAAEQMPGFERSFTGVIGAKVQSNLGFRVAGKIVERFVNIGEQVKAGQRLMRIDETDLRLALTAKRNAAAAARASVIQLDADER